MSEIRYSQEHEWVKLDGDVATIGITTYAQEQLGDVVFVELPEIGKQVAKGKELAVVESVKAASDVYAPISGTVIEVNTTIPDAPEAVNQDAYSAWLFKMKPANTADVDALLGASEYTACAGE